MKSTQGLLADFCQLLAASILFFMSAVLIGVSIEMALGHSLSAISVVIAIPLTALFAAAGCRHCFGKSAPAGKQFSHPTRMFLLLLALLGGIGAGSLSISGYFYDLSWDGPWYHASAIRQLSAGWNPYDDFPLRGSSTRGPVIAAPLLNEYAKGPWVVEAALYQLTGRIEQSKVFNWLLAFACWALFFSALLYHETGIPRALAISTVAALNPVIICQLLSFYVDGQLAASLTCLIAILWILARRPSWLGGVALACIVVILTNIKFTGLFYGAVFSAAGMVWLLATRRKRAVCLRYGVVLALAFGIAILGVGYNPYWTNTRLGRWGIALQRTRIGSNIPANLKDKASLEKLWISMMSCSSPGLEPAALKFPLTVCPDEWRSFYAPDTRVAGFGPLFGGALLLSLGWGIWALGSALRQKKLARSNEFLWGVGALLVATLTMPEAWWARYAPQIWLIPLAIGLLATSVSPLSGRSKMAEALLLGILLLNSLSISAVYFKTQYGLSADLHHRLEALRQYTETVQVDFNQFVLYPIRFREAGIPYQEVAELGCPRIARINPGLDVFYCEQP